MPRISVVIPTLNGASVLGEQLEALARQDFSEPWEVVIADNGCTDHTAAVVERFAGRLPVRTVDASALRGAGAARNAAVATCDADVLLFLDDDDVVAHDWLSQMVLTFDAEPHGVVAGGVSYDFVGRVERPGIGFTSPFLAYGLGANLGIRRDVFEKLGGFDPEFRVAEDVDLCWRAQLEGFRFSRNLHAVIFKRQRAGRRALFRQGFGYGRADVQLFVRFRPHGMGREMRPAARRWTWLVTQLPRLVAGPGRRHWTGKLALALGRLAGSFRHRVLFP